jgi:hypothetical protein
MKKSKRIISYVEKRFYPSETTHGTFMKLDEEMEHDKEFSAGWNDATENR